MVRFSDRIDTRFRYANAAATAKPGYLARKLAPLIRASREKHKALKAGKSGKEAQ